MRLADTVVVVLVPEAGDTIQAMKAGLLEIADVFVVNKADREGADALVSAIEANLALHSYGADQWRPPILETVATTGQGVAELVATIWRFRADAERDREPGGARGNGLRTEVARRRTRSEYRLRELVSHRFMEHLEREVLAHGELGAIVDRIVAREVDPYTAAHDLLERASAGRAVRLAGDK